MFIVGAKNGLIVVCVCILNQEANTDYVNSIQDAINEAKAKAEDFNSREKVCCVTEECKRVSKSIKDETRDWPGVIVQCFLNCMTTILILWSVMGESNFYCFFIKRGPFVLRLDSTHYRYLDSLQQNITCWEKSRRNWNHSTSYGI